jgi:rhodanese-related sulfurtransferase
MPSPNEITVTQLSRLIGAPAAPVIIDVRIDEDFVQDPDLIPTARRHPHDDIAALAPEHSGKRVVIYCQQGKKLSQGSMAILRNHRVQAETLEGGHFAWRDTGELLVPAARIPVSDAAGGSVWVTRHRPKIDRMACPWLIRRFVDARAQLLHAAARS